LAEFERTYENKEVDPAESKSGGKGLKPLDSVILDSIEMGVKQLKERIVYEYVES